VGRPIGRRPRTREERVRDRSENGAVVGQESTREIVGPESITTGGGPGRWGYPGKGTADPCCEPTTSRPAHKIARRGTLGGPSGLVGPEVEGAGPTPEADPALASEEGNGLSFPGLSPRVGGVGGGQAGRPTTQFNAGPSWAGRRGPPGGSLRGEAWIPPHRTFQPGISKRRRTARLVLGRSPSGATAEAASSRQAGRESTGGIAAQGGSPSPAGAPLPPAAPQKAPHHRGRPAVPPHGPSWASRS